MHDKQLVDEWIMNPDSQAIVEPIDEPIFKFRITVLQKV